MSLLFRDHFAPYQWVHLAILCLTFHCGQCFSQVGISGPGECKATDSRQRQLSFSLRRQVDQSDGRWVNAFSAWRKDSTGAPSMGIELNATHSGAECDGVATVHVEAFIKEDEIGSESMFPKREERQLKFHPRHGENAVTQDDGRTVQKLDWDDPLGANAFTNRPLKTNELFEVRLEKRTTKRNHCFGIGVMIHSPENVEIFKEMYKHRNGTWMYHDNGIYHNSKSLVAEYGRNIDTLQVRERVGVMRRDNGELHFFVNGEDQGTAVTRIPEEIYGVVELWYDAVKAKIVY